jgi:rubrerythrin
MTPTTLDYTDLAQAVKVVSASCDGAHALDGTGFSATDAVFGNSLALLPAESWDDDIATAAWGMLSHYRKQLSADGVEFANIPKPGGTNPLAGRDRAIRETYDARSSDKVGRDSTFSVNNGLISLFSPYNKELVSDCREIAGRAWDAGRKVNTFPVEAVLAVRDLAAKWGMKIPQPVLDLPVVAMAAPETHYGIEKVGGNIEVRFAYDPAVVQSVHHVIPSAAFRQADKVWVTVEENVGEAIEFAKKHGLTIQPGLSDDFDKMVETRKEMHDASLATEGTIQIDSAMELHPFQKAGVEYLLKARKAILGDEMGLGKSAQALATIVAENAFPAVIVCPATLKGVWVQEVAKFFPQLSVNVFSGTKSQPWFPADLTIVNYDIVYARVDDLIALNPKALVCDESHRIANGKAKHHCPECGMAGLRVNAKRCPQCKAKFDAPAEKWTVKRTEGVIRISRSMEGDPLKLLLTGTPINNRPIELVSQLIAIDRIDEFGGRWRFAQRYCPGGTGASNLVELNKKLRQLCFIRRKKEDIYTELPPLVDAPVPLEIGAKEMQRYAEIERDVVEFMANRAREIAEEAGEDGDAVYVEKKIRLEAVEHLVRVAGLKTAISHLKYDAVVKWIDDFLADSDEKLIVMGEHISMIEKLSEHFGPKLSVKIRGGVSQKLRMEAVDRFQNDPKTRLFIGSSIAASEGLTLTAASNIAMIEHPWTPSIVAQCAARCWGRISNLHGATMWHLVVPNTIDVEILELLSKKKKVVDAATDGVELDGKQGSVLGDLLVSLARRGGGLPD